METELPNGGVNISACNGRRRLSIGGPPGSGLVWNRRVNAGPREDDPRWFRIATDHYWTFYALRTDQICGISYELERLDLTVEDSVSWAVREAVRLVGVPGERWDWRWDPDPLSWGADEYEVVVDAERGVLLRCASRLRARTYSELLCHLTPGLAVEGLPLRPLCRLYRVLSDPPAVGFAVDAPLAVASLRSLRHAADSSLRRGAERKAVAAKLQHSPDFAECRKGWSSLVRGRIITRENPKK